MHVFFTKQGRLVSFFCKQQCARWRYKAKATRSGRRPDLCRISKYFETSTWLPWWLQGFWLAISSFPIWRHLVGKISQKIPAVANCSHKKITGFSQDHSCVCATAVAQHIRGCHIPLCCIDGKNDCFRSLRPTVSSI